MDVGFASTLRAIQGAPLMPAAPAASFRTSRRAGFECAGSAMDVPLMVTWVNLRQSAADGLIVRRGAGGRQDLSDWSRGLGPTLQGWGRLRGAEQAQRVSGMP